MERDDIRDLAYTAAYEAHRAKLGPARTGGAVLEAVEEHIRADERERIARHIEAATQPCRCRTTEHTDETMTYDGTEESLQRIRQWIDGTPDHRLVVGGMGYVNASAMLRCMLHRPGAVIVHVGGGLFRLRAELDVERVTREEANDGA